MFVEYNHCIVPHFHSSYNRKQMNKSNQIIKIIKNILIYIGI